MDQEGHPSLRGRFTGLTSCAAGVFAETLARIAELGEAITDGALDGEATVVLRNLFNDGARACPGGGTDGVYLDTVIRRG